jgi:hypothetical protein
MIVLTTVTRGDELSCDLIPPLGRSEENP